jgi:hypothetical protein
MKMKLIDILECQQALTRLMQQRVQADKLPTEVAYDLMKNLRKLDHEVRYYRAENARLVRKYGKPKLGPDDKPTGDWEIAQTDVDALSDYWEEHDKLLDRDVEIDLWTINEEQLSGFSLTVADRAVLSILDGADPGV